MQNNIQEIQSSDQQDLNLHEITFQIKVVPITNISFSIRSKQYNNKIKKDVWSIEVFLDNQKKSYIIKRSFSEFQWLLNELRSDDQIYLLPSLGKGFLKTYINTKWFRNEKQLQLRTQNLQRFLKTIQKIKQIYNLKYFQIFVSEDNFSIYRKRYREQRNKLERNFITKMGEMFFKKFTKETDISNQYKNQFKDLQQQVNIVHQNFVIIFQAHTQYYNLLKDFQPQLKEDDEKYNNDLYQIVHSLELIKEQIEENKFEACKERVGLKWEKFKKTFESSLKQYKANIKKQLKSVCERLSKINSQSAKKIQANFQKNFVITI